MPTIARRRVPVSVAIIVAALLAIAVCGAALITGARMHGAFSRADRTQEIIGAVDGILITLLNAETSQRGFILTGENHYLDPYDQSDRILRKRLAELDVLLAEHPDQRSRLALLTGLANSKMAELAESIGVRRSGGMDAALGMVRTNHGAEIMDAIRGVTRDILNEERARLDADYQAVLAHFQRAGILGGITIFTITLVLYFHLRAQAQAQHRQQAMTQALAQANETLERRVAERTAELKTANDFKSRFLANVSHELRTPLNAIIGYAGAIAAEIAGPLGNDRYKGFARQIDISGRHLLHMINDVLDFAKIEAGHLELKIEALDPVALATGCVDMVQPLADAAGLTIDVESDMAPASIDADPLRIRQVLLNLLSNAIKFTPEGRRIHLWLGPPPPEAADRRLLIRLRDEGIGMTAEDIAVAMTPFAQVNNAMGRKQAGTGLGLPLARFLVHRHGGQIEVSSTPGEGTLVEIML
ncbi:CHASE3 domain-containing protein [Tistrella sp. BH-R2-4]|uniref:histidine kinase n=1 Tax=Tistrella arctica TaxID=3133430 RepID=A0ABU9YRN7_9PROT